MTAINSHKSFEGVWCSGFFAWMNRLIENDSPNTRSCSPLISLYDKLCLICLVIFEKYYHCVHLCTKNASCLSHAACQIRRFIVVVISFFFAVSCAFALDFIFILYSFVCHRNAVAFMTAYLF